MDRKVNLATLNLVPILYAVNCVVALVAAWGWNPSADVQAAITVIISSVFAIVQAFAARPWGLAGIGSAVTAIATALAAFHLHISPDKISTGVALLSVILAYVSHQSVTPLPAAIRGTTAEALMLASYRDGKPAQPAQPAP